MPVLWSVYAHWAEKGAVFFGLGRIGRACLHRKARRRGNRPEMRRFGRSACAEKRLAFVQKGGDQGVFFSNTRIENIPSPKTAVCV